MFSQGALLVIIRLVTSRVRVRVRVGVRVRVSSISDISYQNNLPG